MALTASSGCFLNDSEYAQIFGDNFNDNTLDPNWTVVLSGAQEANERLEIKAALNNATEGAIYTVPVERVEGDEITMQVRPAWTTTSSLVGINTSSTGIAATSTDSIIVVHKNSTAQFRVFVNGANVWDSDINAYPLYTWYAVTFRFKTGGGYEIDIDDTTVYSGGSITATPVYIKASQWATTDAYNWYIDDLAYSGYGTFSVHDTGADYIYYADGFDMTTFAVTHSSATDIGARYRTGTDGETWGDWSSWLTEAEFQAVGAVSDAYLQLEVRFKGGIGAYVSAVTLDMTEDVTAPTGPTLDLAVRQAMDDETPVLFGAGATGTDETDYAATTVEVYSGSAWYEVLADGTIQASGTAESYATLWQPVDDAADSTAIAFGILAGDETASAAFTAATQMRLVGWDVALNTTASTAVSITTGAGTAPSAPSLAVTDVGDGTVTATVSGADDGSSNAVYTQPVGGSAWTLLTTITGNGSDTVALSAGAYWAKVESSAFGSTTGQIVLFRATDGTKSELELCLDAVAAVLNAQAYADSDGDAVPASVSIPPRVESAADAELLVFPDGDETDPAPAGANLAVYRVNVVWSELDGGAAQHTRALKVRESIKDLLVGSRLPTLTTLYCRAESSATSVDMAALMRDVPGFVSGITLEFTKYRARS